MQDNLVKNYQLNRLKRHIYRKTLAVLYEFFDTFDIILSRWNSYGLKDILSGSLKQKNSCRYHELEIGERRLNAHTSIIHMRSSTSIFTFCCNSFIFTLGFNMWRQIRRVSYLVIIYDVNAPKSSGLLSNTEVNIFDQQEYYLYLLHHYCTSLR